MLMLIKQIKLQGIALAEASGLKIDDVLDVVNNGAIACPMFAIKGPQMQAGNYPTAFPLKHAQKDMKLALLLADELGVPLPTSAAANEQYKRAKGKGRGDDDFASVHSNYREF
jgi:glyoxylate/succinic semialdehyde reductase